MSKETTPREIVDRQMSAYNARDIDAYCALFSSDAVIYTLSGVKEPTQGIDAIRAGYTARFQKSQKLQYTIKTRIELGNFVIDHELVNGIADETLEVVAIYEVRDSLIRSVRFIWP